MQAAEYLDVTISYEIVNAMQTLIRRETVKRELHDHAWNVILQILSIILKQIGKFYCIITM